MAEPQPRHLPALRPTSQHAQWRWATPQGEATLAGGDLGAILLFHREVHGLTQTELGDILGYDKTYISALELGRRTLKDVDSRRRVAGLLALPPHVLGVTDPGVTDHRAMLQFGEGVVRLAEVARQSGHASDAVAELWPLVARLEARLEDGHAEREVLYLLARARVGLGVALGNVLPEERLSTAAHWTAKGLAIARHFDDPAFASYVLRMHGNELRKAQLSGSAVDRLRHAAALAPDDDTLAAVLPLLARAAGQLGDGDLFDSVLRDTDRLLDTVEHTSLANPYALHEIHLRGLLATGRPQHAVRLAESGPAPTTSVAPQWRVIESVTAARVRMIAGDQGGAAESLRLAVREALIQRLPHQLQRVIRIAGDRLGAERHAAEQALAVLRQQMAA
ncbi:helix-turn-helix domain-containing protein [Actinomycetota bacterium Odt1-20B]